MAASIARTAGAVSSSFQVPGAHVDQGAAAAGTADAGGVRSSVPAPPSFSAIQLTIGEILALAHTVDVHFPDEPYSRPITVSRTTDRMVVVHKVNRLIPLEPKP